MIETMESRRGRRHFGQVDIYFLLIAVEKAARAYARHSHGNMVGAAYRAREEARDKLLDALSQLDVARGG